MTRETIAAALMVWLIGAVVGWCAGWAARGDHNRRWHHGLQRQLAQALTELAQVRAELADALDELDDVQAIRWEAAQMPALVSATVHVSVAAPVAPRVTQHSAFVPRALVVDATPVLPAEGAPS
jgi:hypothetical protein